MALCCFSNLFFVSTLYLYSLIILLPHSVVIMMQLKLPKENSEDKCFKSFCTEVMVYKTFSIYWT